MAAHPDPADALFIPDQLVMKNRIIIASGVLALVQLLSATVGCSGDLWPGGAVELWAVPEGRNLFPDSLPETENDVFRGDSGSIFLFGAVNETVACQLALRAPDRPARVSGIRVTGLHSGEETIAPEHIRLYIEDRIVADSFPAWYLRLTPSGNRRRSFADPLVPIDAPSGALPLALVPGDTRAVWVEVHVPVGTPAGVYAGTLTVETSSGSERSLELLLRVWPFALPGARHLPVLTGVDAYRLVRHHLVVEGRPYAPSRLHQDDPLYEPAVTVIDRTLQLLHRHRCSPILLGLGPVRRLDEVGRWELDWSDYDRLVTGVLDGSVFDDRDAVVAWPLPVDIAPREGGGGGSLAEMNHRLLVDHLKSCVTHFERRGWLDRHFVALPLRAEDRAAGYTEYQRLASLLHVVDPRLRFVCELTPQSMEPYGWINDGFMDVGSLVDIWCPPAAHADASALAQEQQAGKQAWLRPDRPPYSASLSLIAPSVHARAVGWHAYRVGYDAIWLPEVAAWTDDGAQTAIGSESMLIWPGSPYGLDSPVPSIRLKRLMRGLQDVEYLWLLERNGRPATAGHVAASLFRYAGTDCYGEHFLDARGQGWVADPDAWAMALRLLARELAEALGESRGEVDPGRREDLQQLSRQIDWAQLARATERPRAVVEGIRLSRADGDPAHPIRIEATVSVFNADVEPMTGVLQWRRPPGDWLIDSAGVPVDQLASGRSTRRVLQARAPWVRTSSEGGLPVQVELARPGSEGLSYEGRLCALTSQRVDQAMSIDGDLHDWPLATNVASDFVLAGAIEVPERRIDGPDRATQLTTVFICHDDRALYIAFNCEDDRHDPWRISRRNYVWYDDLWPVGEDLVEVVLDPSGKAAGPADLYHILVKANGAVIAERGFRSLARVASHEDWPADITAAVADADRGDRWTVEIRIPLDAVGESASVWGINFARFDAGRGEYSTWAPARSHVGSPVTLGNMSLGN